MRTMRNMVAVLLVAGMAVAVMDAQGQDNRYDRLRVGTLVLGGTEITASEAAALNALAGGSSSSNLTLSGAITVGRLSTTGTLASGNATVTGSATVSGGIQGATLTATGNVTLGGGILYVTNKVDAGSAVATFIADQGDDASDTITLTVADAGAVAFATVASFTVTADGTGDAEVALPNDCIGDAEIAFDEVTGADLTLTDCGPITSSGAIQGSTLTATGTVTLGGGNVNITNSVDAGSAVATFIADQGDDASDTITLTVADAGAVAFATVASFTITADGTGDGEVALPAQAIGNAELADDAVGADELAGNAVVSASIVDQTIAPADVATNVQFTLGDLIVTGIVTHANTIAAGTVGADQAWDTLPTACMTNPVWISCKVGASNAVIPCFYLP